MAERGRSATCSDDANEGQDISASPTLRVDTYSAIYEAIRDGPTAYGPWPSTGDVARQLEYHPSTVATALRWLAQTPAVDQEPSTSSDCGTTGTWCPVVGDADPSADSIADLSSASVVFVSGRYSRESVHCDRRCPSLNRARAVQPTTVGDTADLELCQHNSCFGSATARANGRTEQECPYCDWTGLKLPAHLLECPEVGSND